MILLNIFVLILNSSCISMIYFIPIWFRSSALNLTQFRHVSKIGQCVHIVSGPMY